MRYGISIRAVACRSVTLRCLARDKLSFRRDVDLGMMREKRLRVVSVFLRGVDVKTMYRAPWCRIYLLRDLLRNVIARTTAWCLNVPGISIA